MIRQLTTSGLVIALLSFVAAPAGAYDGYGGCGYGYGYGYLYNVLRYEVPHFAAFPPVYYSHPVPRTYGYSPFAYPPNVLTPEIVGEVEPVEIVNPYVPSTQQAPAEAEPDRTVNADSQPQPLVIVNPFVTPRQSLVQQ